MRVVIRTIEMARKILTMLKGFVIILYVLHLQFDNATSKRRRRYIIFPSGGSYKLVIGTSLPLSLPKYQSVVWVMNMQFIHPQITNISQIAGGLPPTFPIRRKRKTENDIEENDRLFFYSALETLMEKHGVNGRQCLLRSICENAMHSLNHNTNGIWGQLLDILFTPEYEDDNGFKDLGQEYLDARRAGEYGIDCLSLYIHCPLGHGVLDIISVLY